MKQFLALLGWLALNGCAGQADLDAQAAPASETADVEQIADAVVARLRRSAEAGEIDPAALALAVAGLRRGDAPPVVEPEAADARPNGPAVATPALPPTAEVEQAEPEFEPTEPVPAQGASASVGSASEDFPGRSLLHALHLASYRTLANAQSGWLELAGEHGDALSRLEPRLERIDLGERGEYLRLKAGPFYTQADAMKACEALAAKGVYCARTDYTGTRLPL
ncbi:MAG: SPOR domain-containing protein [Maricaulaceae bacterium]